MPPGQEVRYDYDYEGEQEFRRRMLERGIPAADLDSAEFAERRWVVADSAFTGAVVGDDAFAFQTLSELGLDIAAYEAMMQAKR